LQTLAQVSATTSVTGTEFGESEQATFRTTVARSVTSDDADVDPEDIEITNITSVSQRRQLLQTTAVVFVVDYIVTFKVSSVNTGDVESIGEDIIAMLETAVNDGSFAQTLTSVATEDGSGGLLNSIASDFTSEDVTIVSIRTPTPSGRPTGQPSGQPTLQPSKGDLDDFNLPLIVGLSVGAFFLVVLAAAVTYKVTTLDPKKASKGEEYRPELGSSEQPQTRVPAPSLGERDSEEMVGVDSEEMIAVDSEEIVITTETVV
jgi:hypothetical protein